MQRRILRLVFDSSALLNIEDAGRLDSLSPFGTQIIVPAKVEEELRKVPKGGFRPGHGSRRMQTWLSRGSFTLAGLLYPEGRDYLRFRLSLGAGESAAIAIAVHRQAALVIDDVSARSEAEKEKVTCMGAAEFLERLDQGEFSLL